MEALLDKESDIPIHHQLYLILEKKIVDGEYGEDSIMPSEAELESKYAVSRITVRRAISDLEKYGYVKKKRGVGTYVLPQKKYKEAFAFRSFSEETRDRGNVPSSIILDCGEVEADGKISEMLLVKPGEKVGYLKRLRLINGRIAALHETFISLHFGFHIHSEEFGADASLYDFYEKHGVELGYADETIEVKTPSGQIRTELFMKESQALLYRERISCLEDGTPVEFSRNYDKADQQKYFVHMERKKNGGGKGRETGK